MECLHTSSNFKVCIISLDSYISSKEKVQTTTHTVRDKQKQNESKHILHPKSATKQRLRFVPRPRSKVQLANHFASSLCISTYAQLFFRFLFAGFLQLPFGLHRKKPIRNLKLSPRWRLQMVTLKQDHCRVAMVFLAGSN